MNSAIEIAVPDSPEAGPASPEALLAAYQPLLGAIAKQLHGALPTSVELDDLIQWGQVGLLHAISRYSENRNVKFATYAKFRIRGAMLDGLRELDWAPRRVRVETRRRAVAQAKFEASHGRAATESELADALGMSLDEYRERQMQFPPEVVSFSGRAARENEPDIDPVAHQPNPLEAVLAGDMNDRVSAALQRLPERERFIVHSYFWDSRTMADIAHEIGVNESRVCQLRKRAMERMKEYLHGEGIWQAVTSTNTTGPLTWGRRTL